MKKYILIMVSLIFIEGFCSEPKACLAETEYNSINLSYEFGIGDFDTLNRFSIDYEHLLKDHKISLFVRYGIADYKIEETFGWFGNRGEDGDIRGGDLGIRFYPIGKKSMDKLFLGGAFGFFEKKWKESYGYESYSENIKRLDTEIGYRFNSGSKNFSITPSAHLGYHFCDTSTLGIIYYSISISVGFVF